MYMCITYLRLVPWLKEVHQDAEPKEVGRKGEGSRECGGMRCNGMMVMGTSRIGDGGDFSAFSGDLESDKFCPQHRETGLRPFCPIPLLRNTPLDGV